MQNDIVIDQEDWVANPLMKFWSDSRLCNARTVGLQADSAQGTLHSFSGDPLLKNLVSLAARGCGQHEDFRPVRNSGTTAARMVPSAGALYPYEIFIITKTKFGLASFHYSVEENRVSRLDTLDFTSVARALQLTADLQHNLSGIVIFCGRPWKSIKKYGIRGYCYSNLDLSHAACSVASLAAAEGGDVTIKTRIARQRLAKALGLADFCLEPQVGVVLRGQVPKAQEFGAKASVPKIRTEKDALSSVAPSVSERKAWSWLRGVHSYYDDVSEPGCIGMTNSLADQSGFAPDGKTVSCTDGPEDNAAEWRSLMPFLNERRSAHGFAETPMPRTKLDDILSALQPELRMDCAGPSQDTGVFVTLFAQNISSLLPGRYAVGPRGMLDPVPAPEALPSFPDACMNQSVVRHASGLFIIHAPVLALLRDEERSRFAELHFHAGHIGHKLYLGAVSAGLSITGIGGFDEQVLWSADTLSPNQSVLYILAIGQSGPEHFETQEKLDRRDVAYAHGERE